MKSEKTNWKDKLPGGRADGKTPSDYNQDDINIGSKVEREHSSDIDIQKCITMDHLEDSDTYYDELVMSGIADEKDAIKKYNQIKSDGDKKKAIRKIQKHLNKEKEKLGMKESYRMITKFNEYELLF